MTTESENVASTQRPGINYPSWFGPIITFVGCISYFIYFVRFPVLRDFPWLNLPLAILGATFSLLGLWRAFSSANYKMLARVFASFSLLVSAGLACLFVAYIFYFSNLPPTGTVSSKLASAPGFSLADQNGQIVSLTDYQGKNLVITFYRGHW